MLHWQQNIPCGLGCDFSCSPGEDETSPLLLLALPHMSLVQVLWWLCGQYERGCYPRAWCTLPVPSLPPHACLPCSGECCVSVCSAASRGIFRVQWCFSLLVLWSNAHLWVGKNGPIRAGRAGRTSPFKGSSDFWQIKVAVKPQPGSLRHSFLFSCSLLI